MVEVDRETGAVTVLDYTTVHDAGRLLNPLLADGQVRGGFAHGAGAAMFERTVYDEAGNLLTGSFVDYLCPTAADLPPLKIGHRETPSPFTLLGREGARRGQHDERAGRARGRRRGRARAREGGAAAHAAPGLGGASVKPVPFEYRRAETVDEAVDLLAEHGVDAKVLAGGQSFVPMLNMRILRPSFVVDINGIPGLDAIEETNGDIRVGATCRQSVLERSPLVRGRCPLLAGCLPFVGHVVTRNRGTVGGSVAHADAAAELPLALVTLGGTVVAQSRDGRRSIPAEEFFVTYLTTALGPDELVVETVWPAGPRFSGFAFEELAQRHGDYALSMAACALRVEDGLVAEARLGVGAVAPRPTLVDVPLAGQAVDTEAAREAAEAARAAVDPSGHVHASAEYLRHVTGVLAERAVLRAWQDASEAAA